jgi:hypothetical protein
VPRARAALLAALILTAANAGKPLVIDDPVYVAYARQILAHPGDPYGFEIYWGDRPAPAIRLTAVPPVLPYWLAGAMALFGDHPVAWKLSLLPFALALTGSLAFLLDRFARPLAIPLLFALALAPTVLPCLNLMLDVPALALGLLGLVLGLRACELGRRDLALASGLALALAMQTKYSAIVYPGVLAAHAAIGRRLREPALALLVAAALFVGWELLMSGRYGESHFVTGVAQVQATQLLPSARRLGASGPGVVVVYWALCLLSLLGSTAPCAGLLALAGLGARLRSVAVAAALLALAFASLPFFPRAPAFAAKAYFARIAAIFPELFLYVPLGFATLASVGWLALRGLRPQADRDRRADALLAAWLALELAGYCIVAPTPTVRRVIGLGIVLVLIGARAAAQRGAEALAGARVAVAFGLALGLLFYGSELVDARARRELVTRTEQRLAQLGADPSRATIWFLGQWEFRFYGERAGWRTLVPDRSRLARGDWLVVPEGVMQPPVEMPADRFRERAALVAVSASPWTTLPYAYDGPVPLRRQGADQSSARIYRVLGDVFPRSR